MPVRLFVGNLPYDATEEDIRAHFATAGSVLNVFVPLDRETGRKRGFAFVEFNGATEAQEAIRLFNNQPFRGRPSRGERGASQRSPSADARRRRGIQTGTASSTDRRLPTLEWTGRPTASQLRQTRSGVPRPERGA
jgi:RNA recognition motif-containing protein